MTALIATIGCDSESSKPARHPDAQVDAGDTPIAADAAADDAAIAGGAGNASVDAGHDAGIIINDSFETATPVDLDAEHPPLHDITRPGEVDYYSFEAEAGAYYALSTDLHTFSPDTILTLFDADQKQLAQNDDGPMWPGDTYDSRLVVRLDKSGTHYVRVSTHLGSSPVRPPIYYHLTIKRLSPDADGVTLQTAEDPAEVRFARDDMTGYAYATVLGDFAKVRAAAFDVQGQSNQVLVVHVLSGGVDGDGSSAKVGAVSVSGSDDSVVARIDGTDDVAILHPPVSEAKYRLAAALDGKAGDEGYFAIDLVMLDDNPREKAEQDNNGIEGAEPIKFDAGQFNRRGLLLSHLPEKDIDYFRFDNTGPTLVTVGCEAQSGGSGVLGLHAELRDGGDQIIASADETPTANLLVDSSVLMDPGTYYLRLSSKTPTSKDAVEPWVRCVVIARP